MLEVFYVTVMGTMNAVVDRDATVDEAAELLSPVPSLWRHTWRDAAVVVLAVVCVLAPVLLERPVPYGAAVCGGALVMLCVVRLWGACMTWTRAFEHRAATLAIVEQRRSERLQREATS